MPCRATPLAHKVLTASTCGCVQDERPGTAQALGAEAGAGSSAAGAAKAEKEAARQERERKRLEKETEREKQRLDRERAKAEKEHAKAEKEAEREARKAEKEREKAAKQVPALLFCYSLVIVPLPEDRPSSRTAQQGPFPGTGVGIVSGCGPPSVGHAWGARRCCSRHACFAAGVSVSW